MLAEYTCFGLSPEALIEAGQALLKLRTILLIAIYSLLPKPVSTSLEFTHPVFWLETIAILAFGFSWITKGEAILKDEENDLAGSAANIQ